MKTFQADVICHMVKNHLLQISDHIYNKMGGVVRAKQFIIHISFQTLLNSEKFYPTDFV